VLLTNCGEFLLSISEYNFNFFKQSTNVLDKKGCNKELDMVFRQTLVTHFLRGIKSLEDEL
jgi:hypothetical protein